MGEGIKKIVDINITADLFIKRVNNVDGSIGRIETTVATGIYCWAWSCCQLMCNVIDVDLGSLRVTDKPARPSH